VLRCGALLHSTMSLAAPEAHLESLGEEDVDLESWNAEPLQKEAAVLHHTHTADRATEAECVWNR
jgi:hypothetical protein